MKLARVVDVLSVVVLALLCTVPLSARAADLESALGGLKWGATRTEVLEAYRARLLEDYRYSVAGIGDPLEIDRIRRSVDDRFEAVERATVDLTGERTGYEVSVLGTELATGRNLSLVTIREGRELRYWVFQDGTLLKFIVVYDIASLDQIGFEEFTTRLSGAIGEPLRTDWERDALDIKQVVRVVWQDERTRLRAENRSRLFKAYMLVYSDASREDIFVASGAASPAGTSGPSAMDLLNDVTAEEEVDSNVVDSMIGGRPEVELRLRPSDAPTEGSGSAPSRSTAMDDDEELADEKKAERPKKRRTEPRPAEKKKEEGITIY